jgi:trk system potassium uptake protein TrkA
MPKQARDFAVLGLGNFGGTVALELARFGNHVIGVDRSPRVVADYADKLAQALILDSRDEAALREAGVGKCDVALIAMGEDLEASVLSAINLKMLGVPMVWAKAVSKAQHRILAKLGVERVLRPEQEFGQHIAQMLNNPAVRDYVSLGNGFHVVNMIAPPALAGRRLSELSVLRKAGIRCIGVMRGSDFLGAEAEDVSLMLDDKLLLLGTRASLRDFAETI